MSQVIVITTVFHVSSFILALQDLKAQKVHIIPYLIALISGLVLCFLSPNSTWQGVCFVIFSLFLFFLIYKQFPTATADVPYWLITTYLCTDHWVYYSVMIGAVMMFWEKFSQCRTLPFLSIAYVCFLFLKFPLS